METLQAHSHNSVQLRDRTLWFDGDSTVSPSYIIDRIANGIAVESLFVDELTDEIVRYNKLVPEAERITVKKNLQKFSFEWNMPEKYKKLDVVSYVGDKLYEEKFSEEETAAREERCVKELSIYKKLGLFDTLRALIYIINTLTEKNVVWGVGRGSSVSSYVLYLIGVHDIDSFLYELNIEDFLRTE
jgi:DNA polymerase III alpha subunit